MKSKHTSFIRPSRLAFGENKGIIRSGKLFLECVTSSQEFPFLNLWIVRRARAALVFWNNIDFADHSE